MMKKFLGVLGASVALLIQLLSLKELLSKDEHARAFIGWLANLGPLKESGEALSWIGFVTGLNGTNLAAWYTWAIVSLIGSVVVFLAKLAKEFLRFGVDADELMSGALLAGSSFLVLVGTKLTWLFLNHLTFWWLALGIISACVLIWLSRLSYTDLWR